MVESCDIAVIGAGLSGARVLVELAERLARDDASPARLPIRVVAFDKTGEFARGIGYGAQSDRGALLIDTLEQSRCPPFSAWLQARPQELHRLADSQHADDRAWWIQNKSALAAHRFDELYLPRHVFGQFSESVFTQAMAQAARLNLMQVQLRTDEVVELRRLPAGNYRVVTQTGQIESRLVVLAVGSIPRRDQFLPQRDASSDHSYLTDEVHCGSFQLRGAFDRFLEREPAGSIRLVIIGAAASAVESLHCAMNHPRLSERIVNAITLSPSGVLPGRVRSADGAACPVSRYAEERTSPEPYLQTARELIQQNRLRVVPARVSAVRPQLSGYRIDILQQPDDAASTLDADLVINCSGAGVVHTSPAPLLRQLATQLPVVAGGRGFSMAEDYSLSDWPGVYVVGPLLNRADLMSPVESISAVFRIGTAVAASLHSQLNREAAAPERTSLSVGA